MTITSRSFGCLALVLLGFLPGSRADEVINETTPSGIVELLVSVRAEEVARGESSLAARRSTVIAELLEQIQT